MNHAKKFVVMIALCLLTIAVLSADRIVLIDENFETWTQDPGAETFNGGWRLLNVNQANSTPLRNQWTRGTANPTLGGTYSMYISDSQTDGENVFAAAASRVLLVFENITLPTNARDILLEFDFIGVASEMESDARFSVYLPLATNAALTGNGNLTAGTGQLPDRRTHLQTVQNTASLIGQSFYYDTFEWTRQTISLGTAGNSNVACGNQRRLVFGWYNSGRVDVNAIYNPPPAIGNIKLSYITTPLTTPGKPTLMLPTGGSTVLPYSMFRLMRHSDNTTVQNHRIFISTSPTFEYNVREFTATNIPNTANGAIAGIGQLLPTNAQHLAWDTKYYWYAVTVDTGNVWGVPSEIWSFTTMSNPAITTVPYYEGWEHTQTFNIQSSGSRLISSNQTLPRGWHRIRQIAPHNELVGMDIELRTAGRNPTIGNRVALVMEAGTGNNISTNFNLIVVSPLVTNINTRRLRFWVQNSNFNNNTTQIFQVGLLTDPNSHTSFVPVRTYTVGEVGNTWREVVVDFDAVGIPSGQSRYIGFRSNRTNGTSQMGVIHIDDITIQNMPTTAFAPALTSPADGIEGIIPYPRFSWTNNTDSMSGDPTSFRLFINNLDDAAEPIIEIEIGNVNTWVPSVSQHLRWGQRYEWYVIPYNRFGAGTASAKRTFTTADPINSSLPYIADLGNVAVNQVQPLPGGWHRLITGVGEVITSVGSYNSILAGTLRIGTFSSIPADAVIMAVSPPMPNLSGSRIEFTSSWATAAHNIIFGTLSDPNDHTTFVEIHTLVATTPARQDRRFVWYFHDLPSVEHKYIGFRVQGSGGGHALISDIVIIPDPTITSTLHIEDFNDMDLEPFARVPRAMPNGWIKYGERIQIVGDQEKELTMSDDTNRHLTMVATPLITNINQKKLFVRVRGGWGEANLTVGTMTNLNNVDTFIEAAEPFVVNMESLILEVDFENIPDNESRYIALRYGAPVSGRSLWIDAVYIDTPAVEGVPARPTLHAVYPSENVLAYPTISWTPHFLGTQPNRYDVVLTSSADTVTYNAGNNTSWTPTPAQHLKWGTEYSVHVIPHNVHGTGQTSSMSSFTTMADPTIRTFPHHVYLEGEDYLVSNEWHYRLLGGWHNIRGDHHGPYDAFAANEYNWSFDWNGVTHEGYFTTLNTPGVLGGLDDIVAVSPFIQDLSGKRLRFFSNGDQSSALHVGTMTDPTDASTFSLVSTIDFEFDRTTEGYVDFTDIPMGQGRYIGFRHAFVPPDDPNDLNFYWPRAMIGNMVIDAIPAMLDFPYFEDFGTELLSQYDYLPNNWKRNVGSNWDNITVLPNGRNGHAVNIYVDWYYEYDDDWYRRRGHDRETARNTAEDGLTSIIVTPLIENLQDKRMNLSARAIFEDEKQYYIEDDINDWDLVVGMMSDPSDRETFVEISRHTLIGFEGENDWQDIVVNFTNVPVGTNRHIAITTGTQIYSANMLIENVLIDYRDAVVIFNVLEAYEVGYERVRVHWNVSLQRHLYGYHVYKSETDNINTAVRINDEIILVSAGMDYRLYDEDVEIGGTYYYWVKVQGREDYEYITNSVMAYVQNNPSVVFETFEVVEIGNGSVNVSWSTESVYRLHGFRILRGDTDELDDAVVVSGNEMVSINVEAEYMFNDTDVIAGATYYYWIRAIGQDDFEYNYGYRKITMVELPSVVFESFNVVENEPGKVNVTWTLTSAFRINGFNVLRGVSDVLDNAVVISGDALLPVNEYHEYLFVDNITSTANYYYWIEVIGEIGYTLVEGPKNIQITVSECDIIDVPHITALVGNYPNPFNPQTTIKFEIGNNTPSASSHPSTEGNSHVRVDIYNVRGQHVRTLVNGIYGAGSHSVVWNGTDDYGRGVSSGMYFYRMTAGEYSSVRRMMLLK